MAVGDGFNDGLMMQYANISVEIIHSGQKNDDEKKEK